MNKKEKKSEHHGSRVAAASHHRGGITEPMTPEAAEDHPVVVRMRKGRSRRHTVVEKGEVTRDQGYPANNTAGLGKGSVGERDHSKR